MSQNIEQHSLEFINLSKMIKNERNKLYQRKVTPNMIAQALKSISSIFSRYFDNVKSFNETEHGTFFDKVDKFINSMHLKDLSPHQISSADKELLLERIKIACSLINQISKNAPWVNRHEDIYSVLFHAIACIHTKAFILIMKLRRFEAGLTKKHHNNQPKNLTRQVSQMNNVTPNIEYQNSTSNTLCENHFQQSHYPCPIYMGDTLHQAEASNCSYTPQ